MKPNVFAFLISPFVAIILTVGYVAAHHSFAAEFDAEKPVTLKGIVVKWEMMNPHGWITVDVTGPGGERARWMVETSNPNGLMRLGWTKNSLKAGRLRSRSRHTEPRTDRTQQTPRGSLWRMAATCLPGSSSTPSDASAQRRRESEETVKTLPSAHCFGLATALSCAAKRGGYSLLQHRRREFHRMRPAQLSPDFPADARIFRGFG